jgi:type I restriction enzyme S subunit
MADLKNSIISSFCLTGSGGTPSRSKMERYYENGTIPWVKSGELRESVINKTEEYVTESALKESSIKLVPAGAILLAMYGATVGRLGILGIEATTNQAVCHIIPDPAIADARYLFHALSQKVPSLIAKGVGGAQPNINQSIIKELPIFLPPLLEQRCIAAILDQADALRAKRREALAQLDKLTQSIFIEMFGDPVTNPKGWGMSAFGTVCETRLGKMLDQKQQTGEHSYKYIRNANVQWFHFDLSAVFEMDFDENARNTFSLKDGDLLICEGGEPGRAAIWRNQITNCYYQKALHRARPNLNVAVPEYLMWLLWFLAHRGGLGDHITSATISHLTGEKLKAMTIPVPPITLQNQFVVQLTAVDKIKSKHQKSLFELDNLFASLQHSAFHGEL